MSEFKGTKGKWKITDREFNSRISLDFGIYNQTAHLWFGDKQEETKEKQKANARLICCAPEMLEALQYFVNRVEEGTIKSKTTYTKYKELIKKATEL